MSGVPYHAWTHRPKAQGGTDPIPGLASRPSFRARIREIADPESDRVHYVNDLGDADNIYWDYWDPSFDTSVFSIEAMLETNDPDEGEVIAGVELLKRGVYSITALIDVQEYFDGKTLLRSNWDRGQVVFQEHNQNWDSSQGIRLDQWRYLNDQAEDWWADGSFVEIVFGQENSAVFGGGSDLWVPGGTNGAWGLVPTLGITYWGEIDSDPDFFQGIDL